MFEHAAMSRASSGRDGRRQAGCSCDVRPVLVPRQWQRKRRGDGCCCVAKFFHRIVPLGPATTLGMTGLCGLCWPGWTG